MNLLDKKGVAARDLYKELADRGVEYNEQRKANTARLRTALEPVWAALKPGGTVNGCKSITDCSRWANPNPKTKNPERWFQQPERSKQIAPEDFEEAA